ncbi:MAG: UDP-N-acetylglucosamine 2-epimerase (non-hydrolyzing) [Acidimicrobiales bacterium]
MSAPTFSVPETIAQDLPATGRPHRVLTVFGTRPEAIKMAPVIQQLQRDPRFVPQVVVTGQHREMLDQVLDVFAIVPDLDLAIMDRSQTLTDVTTRALGGLSRAVDTLDPDLVVVQGDTTTTLCGALAAFYARRPVAHLEAGLRTGDILSPFPEEANRRLTTQLASLHLAPTERSRDNLLAEGVDPATVVVTGNTVIDALHEVLRRPRSYGEPALESLDSDDRRVVLITAHRRESWGDAMHRIARAVVEVAADPDVLIVFPLHRNPVVRACFEPVLRPLANVVLCEPLPYAGLVKLLHRCTLVITDSGGLQEEAPGLGKPVLVLRDTTERPEGVDAGTARLIGTDRERIVAEVRRLLYDPAAYAAMAAAVNPYGDGTAAVRSVDAFARLLGGTGPAAHARPVAPSALSASVAG